MTVNGIDVSSRQETDFSTSGLEFGFVKATEGHTYINPYQGAQATKFRNAGAVVGFYHFLWPGNIKEQAAYFVERCVSVEGDVLICDWETTPDKTFATCAEKDAFLAEVKRLRPDHKVILYCNRDFWLHKDVTSGCMDGLWIAQYNGDPGHPDIEHPWLFHQYNDVDSKGNSLDVNLGNFSSLAALRTWAGTPTPEPVEPKYEPYPGLGFFVMKRKSPIIAAMHKRLSEVGCNRYKTNKNVDVIGSGDVASYEAWQRKYNKDHHKNWPRTAMMWPPGKETWDALKVPNV